MTDFVNDSVPRSSEEIEAALAATRLELTDTVNDLVAQLQPAHLLEVAKEDLSRRFVEAKQQAMETFGAARQGDQEAIRKVGVAAVAAAGVVGLVIWRVVRR